MKPGYILYPSIPSFELSFEPEISKDKIEQELKPDTYSTMLGVLGYDFKWYSG